MAVCHASVLVADDDPLLCSLLVYKLGQCGLSVITASDGELALDLIRDKVPELLVLDSMMPVLDGISVLRQVREKYSPVELPVVMLTARDGSGHRSYRVKSPIIATRTTLLSGSIRHCSFIFSKTAPG